MNKIKAFTLIEISAVIVILLLLISLSIPLLNKGSSQHEVKLITQSVQSLLSLCSSLAKSAGKVYMADMDLSFSSFIKDPSVSSTDTPYHTSYQLYRFSLMRIYSCQYNETKAALDFSFERDSVSIPVSMGGYISLKINQSTPQSDHIYFKPDGSIACDTTKILFCSPNQIYQYHVLDVNKTTGTFASRCFKD